MTPTKNKPTRKTPRDTTITSDDPGVHVTFLLDRSGSMSSIASDVRGGFDAYVAEQRAEPGSLTMTLVTFDSQGIDVLYQGLDVHEVPPLDFKPRGGTPLYDSMAFTIELVDRAIEGTEGGRSQVVVIYTDGLENQSRVHTSTTIKDLVETRQGRGWTFVYLGANQDAWDEAAKFGGTYGSTQTYDATSDGVVNSYAVLSSSTSSHRAGTRSGALSGTNASFLQPDKPVDEEK